MIRWEKNNWLNTTWKAKVGVKKRYAEIKIEQKSYGKGGRYKWEVISALVDSVKIEGRENSLEDAQRAAIDAIPLLVDKMLTAVETEAGVITRRLQTATARRRARKPVMPLPKPIEEQVA